MRLYKRGSVYWLDVSIEGHRLRQSTGQADYQAAKREASRMMREFVPATNQPQIVAPTKAQVEALIDQWREDGLAPSTINKRIGAIRKEHPALPFKLPHMREIKGRIRWLTRDEEVAMRRALYEIDPDVADLALVALYTASRRSEVLNLTTSQIRPDLHFLDIYQGKVGGQIKTVPIHPSIHDLLVRRLYEAREAGRQELFPDLQPSRVSYVWTILRKRLPGLADTHFHDLRHTAASRMVQAGVSMAVVKDMLGHADIKSTQIYSHLAPENLQAGCAMI